MPRILPVGVRVGDDGVQPEVKLDETEVFRREFFEAGSPVLPDDHGEHGGVGSRFGRYRRGGWPSMRQGCGLLSLMRNHQESDGGEDAGCGCHGEAAGPTAALGLPHGIEQVIEDGVGRVHGSAGIGVFHQAAQAAAQAREL